MNYELLFLRLPNSTRTRLKNVGQVWRIKRISTDLLLIKILIRELTAVIMQFLIMPKVSLHGKLRIQYW